MVERPLKDDCWEFAEAMETDAVFETSRTNFIVPRLQKLRSPQVSEPLVELVRLIARQTAREQFAARSQLGESRP